MLIHRLIQIAILTLTIVSILSLKAQWWLLALLDQPRPQYVLALAVLLVVALFLWRAGRFAPTWPFIAFIGLIANFDALMPYFWPSTTPDAAPLVSITHLNINKDKLEALDYLSERDEDILFIQELTPTIADEFAARLPDYEVVASQPLWNTHGSALLVRSDWVGEVLSAEFLNLPADNERPLLAARVRIDNTELLLLSLHAIRPHFTDGHAYNYQRTEYEAVAMWLALQSNSNQIVIGDFNATPWSAHAKLLTSWGLQDSGHGNGLQPTWPGSLPSLLRIPIDNALIGRSLVVVEREVGRSAGSDHMPLHIVVGITR